MPKGNPAPAEADLARARAEEVPTRNERSARRARPWLRQLGPDALGAGAAVSLTLIAQTIVLKLWDMSPRVPLDIQGDRYLSMVAIRNTSETGWWTGTDKLGAPLGQDIHDYPAPGDVLHFFIEKVLTWFTSDPGLILNIFFLATFPAVALAAYIAFRGVGIRRATSVAVSVLYALLPYHFLRGEAHLFLSSYFAVPLIGMLVVRQLGDRPLARIEPGERWALRRVTHRDSWFATVIVLLVATTGVYYAVFGLIVLAVAGASGAARTRRWSDLLVPAGLCGVMVVALGLQLLPTLLYHRAHGDNPDAIVRSFAGIETYSLKFSNMLLPLGNHRIGWLADLRLKTVNSPVSGEGSETLGIVGAIGLVLLVIVGLMSIAGRDLFPKRSSETLRAAAACTIALTLVAVISGFSSVIGAFGFTEIRAWNRISVYIAFFALVATAVLVDHFVALTRRRAFWSVGAAALLLVVGAYDQTAPAFAPNYEAVGAAWRNDKGFVKDIEEAVGPNASIFQLPIARFPEQGHIANMPDYELAAGYIHSKTLHWSYGGMKGRESDWQLGLGALPTDELLEDISVVGFDGIYIDRRGFVDGAAVLEAELTDLLGAKPFPSANQNHSFFDIRDYRDDLVRKMGADVVAERRTELITPTVRFGSGFYGVERAAGGVEQNWSTAKSDLALENDGDEPLEVVVTFRYLSLASGPWTLEIEGAGVDETLPMSDQEASVRLDITIPPGTSKIRLSTDTPADVSTDPRDLHFRILDLEYEAAPGG